MLDTMSKHPPTSRGVVFFSALNRDLVRTGLRAWEVAGRLLLLPFPGPAGTDDTYTFTRDFANAMMLNAALYDLIPFDKFLLVQVGLQVPAASHPPGGPPKLAPPPRQLDAMVCRRDWSVETGLGRFIDYDYIGAPWNGNAVGNGGFSWRSKVRPG